MDEMLSTAENQRVWFKAALDWVCPADYNEDTEIYNNVITVIGNAFLEVYRYPAGFVNSDVIRDVDLTEITAWKPGGINFLETSSKKRWRQKIILGSYFYDPEDEKTDVRINELCECFEDPRIHQDYDPDILEKKPHLGSRRMEIIATLSPTDFSKEIERIKREEIFRFRGIGEELSKKYRL